MMPTSSGSEARWREEAMPGETFGEVMRRKASAEVMPPSVGRNALKSISGRKARFAGKEPLQFTDTFLPAADD